MKMMNKINNKNSSRMLLLVGLEAWRACHWLSEPLKTTPCSTVPTSSIAPSMVFEPKWCGKLVMWYGKEVVLCEKVVWCGKRVV